MRMKKIFKIVENNFYTPEYCEQLIDDMNGHLETFLNNILTQEFNLLYIDGLFTLVSSTIREGKVEVDIKEIKRRTTTKQISAMVDEFKVVAKLSNKYKKNKEKYLDL